MKPILWPVPLVMLAGCVSSGSQVKEVELRQFEKGKTTLAQVYATLGPPSVNTLAPNGDRIIVYSGMKYTSRASSFIPVVGLFAGGGDMRMTTATLTFTPEGILRDYSATAVQSGATTGIAAGSQAQVPQRKPPN